MFAGSPINHLFIREFSNLVNSLFSEGYRFCIVVGGGKIARSYISVAKSLGANNFELDELGISITRANASLFIPAIFSAHVEVLSSIKSASNVLALNQTPIFGGTHPGFSSDAVAALIAEFVGGNFYNLSNVDGIFSSDPKKSSSPKLFSELSHNQLVELSASSASSPGQNFVIDLVASKILARSNIKSFFLNGLDLQNFKNCILGKDFKGTVVSSSDK